MSKSVYKVTAATGFRGYAEGEEFEAELSEAEERRAKDRGSIRVVKRAEEKSAKKREEESDG